MSGGVSGLIQTIILCTILLSCFIVACSPMARYKVLSTVFDGVPNPEYDTLVVSAVAILQIDSDSLSAAMQQVVLDPITYHSPFKEKKCAACHDQNRMGELIDAPPQLCYQCHREDDYTQEQVHGPVAGGYCITCHHPHKSENDNLLLDTSEELCFNCHSSEPIAANKVHQEARGADCISCHNPHSSNKKFMLKSGTCSSCHDDFTADYSFVHGPVAMGYCAECHDDHSGETENLLLRQDQSLCLECHEGIVNESVPGNHREWSDQHCTECHNPHGGENRFLLN